jgi:hypothetical protein
MAIIQPFEYPNVLREGQPVLKKESAIADRENGGPRSLARLLGLFDALARSPDGLSLADLNVALESPKSSLLNLLRPLVSEGYVLHDGNRYRLGPAIFRLAANIMSVWNFSKLLHPYLEELASRCHETVYLGVLDREHGVITYVDVIESAKSVRYAMPVGTRRPLYCTAAGRLLLAHADQNWQDRRRARPYPVEFVDALTKAGWLAALIPQQYGGSGLSLAEASVIMEEINRSGGNSGACHGQMYTMGTCWCATATPSSRSSSTCRRSPRASCACSRWRSPSRPPAPTPPSSRPPRCARATATSSTARRSGSRACSTRTS